jgi:antitoxin component of MazEF toxin-antitoxin module
VKTLELKVARIGNSRGVRIPADVLRRYAVGDTLLMIESPDGILLRPKRQEGRKLPWAETARAMASGQEDWSAWDAVACDGMEADPWGGRSRWPRNRFRMTSVRSDRPGGGSEAVRHPLG